VSGQNSFTEGKPKSRIEKLRFANVSDLQKDDDGGGGAEIDGATTSS